jgi:cobalt/nickel transport system permease protein
MHIPDNFLSTPVWATLDVVAIPAFGIIARHASRQMEDARIPLLGVMGAFVFAAQMINFPVGLGTSAHLVGGALLAYALGPAFAVITLTAILATQAFVFQDGGVLALGANVFNMAIAGVLVASVFYQLWGRGRGRSAAIFLGAFFSVMVSGVLALGELLVSKVPMSRELVLGSIGLFTLNALAEGAITLAVIQAIERLNPGWVQKPEASNRKIVAALGAFALLLVGVGFLLASTAPDGLERIGILTGMASKSTFHAPLADYQLPFWSSNWGRRAVAGIAGLGVIFGLCAFAGKVLGGRPEKRKREAACTT